MPTAEEIDSKFLQEVPAGALVMIVLQPGLQIQHNNDKDALEAKIITPLKLGISNARFTATFAEYAHSKRYDEWRIRLQKEDGQKVYLLPGQIVEYQVLNREQK